MKKNFLHLFLLLSISLITSIGCGDSSSKFEGIWRNIKFSNELLTITKSGKNFIIEMQNTNNNNVEKQTGTYDKGNDKLIINNSGYNIDAIIDERTQNLIIGNKEFIKL